MKVLCCGSRHWTNAKAIIDELTLLPEDTIIVHGAARGADSMVDYFAQKRGLATQPWPAQWKQYGKSAGPMRNQFMLDSNPDIELVIAFHENIEESKGTKDMVARAKRKGIPVKIITGEQEICEKI